MSSNELKKRIREWDTEEWEKELSTRSTLGFYAEGKNNIGYNHCYRNSRDSVYYARARTNSLKLEEAIGRGNKFYNKTCKLCGKEEEDLLHFMIKCTALESKRCYKIIDKNFSDPRQRLIEVLYRQEDHRGVGWMIRAMWLRRKAILKCKENMYKESSLRKKKNEEGLNRSDPGPMGTSQTPIRERIARKCHSRG